MMGEQQGSAHDRVRLDPAFADALAVSVEVTRAELAARVAELAGLPRPQTPPSIEYLSRLAEESQVLLGRQMDDPGAQGPNLVLAQAWSRWADRSGLTESAFITPSASDAAPGWQTKSWDAAAAIASRLAAAGLV